MNYDAENEITLYPNPSSGKIYFNSSKYFTGAVTVYDVLGNIVFTDNNISQLSEINLSGLKSGVYIIGLVSESQTFNYSIILK
jgi:hypothetical protein